MKPFRSEDNQRYSRIPLPGRFERLSSLYTETDRVEGSVDLMLKLTGFLVSYSFLSVLAVRCMGFAGLLKYSRSHTGCCEALNIVMCVMPSGNSLTAKSNDALPFIV